MRRIYWILFAEAFLIGVVLPVLESFFYSLGESSADTMYEFRRGPGYAFLAFALYFSIGFINAGFFKGNRLKDYIKSTVLIVVVLVLSSLLLFLYGLIFAFKTWSIEVLVWLLFSQLVFPLILLFRNTAYFLGFAGLLVGGAVKFYLKSKTDSEQVIANNLNL
ncbi:MAG: hypothetical protein A3J46_05160 [Candidatus Yanofskybacteria bacterium RIFCSPHIGHO2_02_FULL_41_11]|uniref:Uncharacterized protein n=1 Tax=Candidatus Yanofskybacteria bacterium RIFCSPHIGHO2_02_FULL_41_11 TaxID=1802675 RepID=A0A1F8F7J2_9BACT|nr:MAG: hypothetical protein A3J46_05160 [Candidatus Yanofskybacteria bacterium RIFCSPHIGHO2_02_FULL_41_11]